jgi:HD-like signal output (HDOD) protein
MGKIVFSSEHPTLLRKVKKICEDKHLPQTFFEDIAAGMNHAEIGSLIAEKWNFPDNLVTAIRYHHDPLHAPENMRELVDTVYMANMFCAFEKGDVQFDQLEPRVLARFRITDSSHLEAMVKRFSTSFAQRES